MVRDLEFDSDVGTRAEGAGLLLGTDKNGAASGRRSTWQFMGAGLALATACVSCVALVHAGLGQRTYAVAPPAAARELAVEKAITVASLGDGPFSPGEAIDLMDSLHVPAQKFVLKDGYIELATDPDLVLSVGTRGGAVAQKPFKRGMNVCVAKKQTPIADAQAWNFTHGVIRLASTSTFVLSAYTVHTGKDTRRLHVWMDCNPSRKKIPMHTRECSFHSPLQTFALKDKEFVLVGEVPQRSGAAGNRIGYTCALVLCIVSSIVGFSLW